MIELSSFNLNDTIIERINGQLLIGANYGPVSTGGNAFYKLASHIEKNGISENGKLWLTEALNLGKESRSDNYKFMMNNFIESENYSIIAESMRESSELFKKCIQFIEQNEINELVENLRKIGEIERKAGEELISISKKN